MTPKINEEQALVEANAWMDAKKVSPAKRESDGYKDAIEALVRGFMYGQLSFNPDNGQLTQHLQYPLELKDSAGNVTNKIEILVYKNRITEDSVTTRLKGIKEPDPMTYMRAYIAAAASQPIAVIGRLDTDDISLSRTIGSFFYVEPYNIDAAVKTVVREHHWSPDVVAGLFLDNIDKYSLFFWYDDIHQMYNDLKSKK